VHLKSEKRRERGREREREEEPDAVFMVLMKKGRIQGETSSSEQMSSGIRQRRAL
jgi:hypothetical protein